MKSVRSPLRNLRGDERSDEWKVVSYTIRQYISFAVASLQASLLVQSHLVLFLSLTIMLAIAILAASTHLTLTLPLGVALVGFPPLQGPHL